MRGIWEVFPFLFQMKLDFKNDIDGLELLVQRMGKRPINNTSTFTPGFVG